MRRALTRRVVQMRPSSLPDGSGGARCGWIAGTGHWAEVTLASAAARRSDWGPAERLRARIVIHAVPEDHPGRPRPGERLRDGARLWSVEAVHPEGQRGRYLMVFATSVGEGAA